MQPPTVNNAVSGLRFLFNVTLVLLGHSKLNTAALYAQVATRTIRAVTTLRLPPQPASRAGSPGRLRPLERLKLLMEGADTGA